MFRSFVITALLFCSPVNFSQEKIAMKKLADLDEKLHETSGLAVVDDYIITQNDSGNKSEIYAINKKGEIERTIELEDAPNKDWEDLALDNQGRLYIGDVGNNYNSREWLKIYVLPKGFVDEKKIVPQEIKFRYEDQKDFPPDEDQLYFDCEGFMCAGDKIYIFTKCRTKPFTGISRVYELSQNPGIQIAKRIGEINLCKTGWQFCSVTAADYHEASKTLVLLTYSRMYLVKDFLPSNPEKWKGNLKSYQLPVIRQREAICFKSANEWYMTDENHRALGGGNLYRVYFDTE